MFVIFVCALFLQQCQTGVGVSKKPTYATEVNSAMRTVFASAEAEYRAQNYTQALDAYHAYIKAYAYNSLTDESYYKIAKIHFLKKDYANSIGNFENIIRHSPDAAYVGKAGHYAGYAAFLAGDYPKSYQLLKDVKPSTLPVKLRLQFFSLAISLSEKDAAYADFSDYALLRLYDTYEEVALQLRDFEGQQVLPYESAQSRLQTWVATPVLVANISDWMKHYPVAPAKEHVDYKIAKAYFTEKQTSKSTAVYLNTFLKNYPRSQYAVDVKRMLTAMGAEIVLSHEKPFQVGVILPAGEGAIYGNAVMQGITCAVGLEGACGETSSVEIVKAESGWDAATLRVAFEEMKTKNVAAVIALVPTLGSEAASLGVELNIPTFLISQQDGLMKQGESIFQMGLIPAKQIEDLVETAIKNGQKRFAIYYPDMNYGQVMSGLFEKEVQSRGGKVIAKVSYKKGSPDPYESAENLQKAINAMGAQKRLDALFIPDSYLQLGHLITGLQFYKLTGFPLLGTNAWNDPKLSNTINALYPNSLFVDIYNASDSSDVVSDFKTRFSQSYNKAPSVLNALGYDTMMMIRSAVSQSGPNRLQSTLKDRFGYRGVTGIRGFLPGEAPIVQTSVIYVKTVSGH